MKAIGNNIKLILNKLKLSQTLLGEKLGRKEQSWVSNKLNGLGDNPEELTEAQIVFLQDVIKVINGKISYAFSFDEITLLDFRELTENEIMHLEFEQWVKLLKERHPSLKEWISNQKEKELLLIQKIQRLLLQNRVLYSVFVILGIVMGLIAFKSLKSGRIEIADCRQPNFGGQIYLDNFTTVTREIDLCGKVCDVSKDYSYWLFFNKRHESGEVDKWPKGKRVFEEGDELSITLDKFGNWCATIFESGSAKDTIFDLELIKVDSIGNFEIKNWFKFCDSAGFYPPFNFTSQAKYFQIDLIEGIRTIKIRPNPIGS